MVDSPFGRLTELMLELCEEQRIPIPRPFMRVALSMMRRSVKKRAAFSLDDVAPLDLAPRAFIPALFGESPLVGQLDARGGEGVKMMKNLSVFGKLSRNES